MKIETPEPIITVTFNKEEIEFLRGLTQNYLGENLDEPVKEEGFYEISIIL